MNTIDINNIEKLIANSGFIGRHAYIEFYAGKDQMETLSISFNFYCGEDDASMMRTKEIVEKLQRAAAAFNAVMVGISSPLPHTTI